MHMQRACGESGVEGFENADILRPAARDFHNRAASPGHCQFPPQNGRKELADAVGFYRHRRQVEFLRQQRNRAALARCFVIFVLYF